MTKQFWKTSRSESVKPCGCCLLKVGFGVKLASRLTRIPVTTLKRVKRGIADDLAFTDRRTSHKGGMAKWGEKWDKNTPARMLRLQCDAFRSEQDKMRRGDERTHWGNHPVMANWNYYKDHEKSKRYGREMASLRFRTDPQFRIKSYLRSRMKKMVRTQGTRRAAKTEALLGCTIVELQGHISWNFEPGMSWDNYGEWHIDHIRPCASFDLRDEAQQRACFHYTNLQPLWATDNIAKGSYFNGKHHRHVKPNVTHNIMCP